MSKPRFAHSATCVSLVYVTMQIRHKRSGSGSLTIRTCARIDSANLANSHPSEMNLWTNKLTSELLYKAKRQHLLTLQVSRYCLLALQSCLLALQSSVAFISGLLLYWEAWAGALLQRLNMPAWQGGDRGFETHFGLQVSKKQMFLPRPLVKIQYCGEPLRLRCSVLGLRPQGI